RTRQWALDNRKEVPSARQFRSQLCAFAREMLANAMAYSLMRPKDANPEILQRPIAGIETLPGIRKSARLILTSPPYPGVHILYHRWQVQGRREAPAPYWIANILDGNGASYYTFGDRNQDELDSYYDQALAAFSSIAQISAASTVFVQMIASSEPSS